MLFKNKDHLQNVKLPTVMGILNINDNSFYTESRKNNEKAIIETAEKMMMDGAEIIDIGAQSTRPGAIKITESEEIKAIEFACNLILKHFKNVILSIDTFRANVAEKAIQLGAHWINDISAGNFDKKMLQTIAKYKVPYIAMHVQGEFNTMHKTHENSNIVLALHRYFSEKKMQFHQLGIHDWILDPGFGFSKTAEENYTILQNLHSLKIFNAPIVVGISRKRMIWQTLETNIENSLNGTTAAHTLALIQGANILRVHDVKEAVETVKIVSKYLQKS